MTVSFSIFFFLLCSSIALCGKPDDHTDDKEEQEEAGDHVVLPLPTGVLEGDKIRKLVRAHFPDLEVRIPTPNNFINTNEF